MSPDIRKHRGAHPEDPRLFAREQLPSLRAAVEELSWLLTRGYSIKGALKLVGDKFTLTERQRLAVSRAACSDQSREHRAASCIDIAGLKGARLMIDGFNLLITVEAALSGGLLIRGADNCIRDLSSVHGSYRSVNETEQAIMLIGEALETLGPGPVQWILDQPISNSGRLAKRIRDLAKRHHWNWSTDLAFNPDAEIIGFEGVVISSDGPLLDRVQSWTNLSQYLIDKKLAEAWLVDLSL